MNSQQTNNSDKDNQHTNKNDSLNVDFDSNIQRGIQLMQRPTTAMSSKDGAYTGHKESDLTLQEKPWTLDDIVQRYKFVTAMNYPTTAPSHTVLGRFRVPQDLVSNNTMTQAPFNNFLYWNGDVVVASQMTATPMGQGCVAMVYIPLSDTNMIESTLIPNFSALTSNQCCFLFPNTNTSGVLRIKFTSPYSTLNVENTLQGVEQRNTLGYLYFVVFNPLELSTNSSDTVSISLFSYFEDNKFRVPRLNGVQATPRVIKPQGDDVEQPEPSSPNIVEKIANKVLPENVVGDVIDAGLGLFGLDKPTVSKLCEPNKVLSTQYMNFSKGAEYLDKMSLNASDVIAMTQDTFGTTTDEMEYSYLFSKYTYMGSFKVTTAHSVGDVVASFPMNPCPVRIENGSSSKVPLLQYLCTPYQFWNGEISYKLQIISTINQTCKLMVGFNYGTYTPNTTNIMEQIASQYGQIIEINQGSNVIDFTPPYLAQTPRLHVPNSNRPSEYDSLGMINIAVLNRLAAANGAPTSITVNVYIAGGKEFNLSTLTASKDLAPFVSPLPNNNRVVQKKKKYIEYVDTDDDIEVVEITKNMRKLRPQASAQPLITPVSDIMNENENLISASEDQAHPRPSTAQHYIASTRDLLRKYQLMRSYQVTNPPDDNTADILHIRISDYFGNTAVLPSGTLPPTNSLPRFPKGNFSLIQMMYRLFKGSLNFKIMPRNPDNISYDFAVYYQPPSYNVGAIQTNRSILPQIKNQLNRTEDDALAYNTRQANEYGYPISTRLPVHYVNGINKTAEFTVPYSSRLLSILSSQGPLTENSIENTELTDLGDLYILFTSNQLRRAENLYFDVFMSLSDDARFGTQFTVPELAPYSYLDDTGTIISSSGNDDYGTGAPISNTLFQL
jgi:hypothetical protein